MKTLAQWLGEQMSPEIPLTLPIYQQQRLSVSIEEVKTLALKFGVKGNPQEGEGSYLVADKKKIVIQHRFGPTFFYADHSKLDNAEYHPELASEEQAKEAALQYLKENKWLPRNGVVDAVHVNHFEQIEGKDRVRKLRPNNICVDLRLSLGPLNTYGSGAKIKVFLGAKNEVIGLFHSVPKLRKVAEVHLTSPRSLEKVLTRKLGMPPEQIEFKNATLAYIVDSTLSGNRLVQPAFVLTLATTTTPKRSLKPVTVEFMTHPLPASPFAPMLIIDAPRAPIELAHGAPLQLSCVIQGGKKPYKIVWESNFDGVLGVGPNLKAERLSIAHRERRVVCHSVKATVTDANGLQDSHSVLVRLQPSEGTVLQDNRPSRGEVPDDPFVGVEWCNLYHGAPGLADISGTDPSAQGFEAGIKGLSGWSSRFDWGNDNAWEEDFKSLAVPGGGTDSYWADNVHFAFFAGHGSSGAFYFGSQVDDHQMLASDARWGDGLLNWVVLHACQTMQANFAWDVWCDSFCGVHEVFGFHTNTEGSTPPLGSRFVFWSSIKLPFTDAFDLRTAWRLACSECFDSSVENAVIYANQSGTDTHNDRLPGFGYVSTDPTSPTVWVYSKQSC